MYKELTIKNIKTFEEEQKLKIAPLTLLYGENSSGKTTLLKTFDIVHNIFSEAEVKRGKNSSQKNSSFYRNENIQNISSKKIHYYSSKLNKKKIEIEIDMDIDFETYMTDLNQYFDKINKKTKYLSFSFDRTSTNFFTPDEKLKLEKNEVLSVPIKIKLEIKYFKNIKSSKINKILIKKSDGTPMVTFTRINKKYKPIQDVEKVGYTSDRFKKILANPGKYSPAFHRGRPIAEADYFVDKELYADYKMKIEKNNWEYNYKLYLNTFLNDNKIKFRKQAFELLLENFHKQHYGSKKYLSEEYQKYYLYYLVKFIINQDTNSKDLALVKKEIYACNKGLDVLKEDLSTKPITKVKKIKFFTKVKKRNTRWLKKVREVYTNDLNSQEELEGYDIVKKDNTKKEKFFLIAKTKKKERENNYNKLAEIRFAKLVTDGILNTNNLVIHLLLKEEKPKTFSQFASHATWETEQAYKVRFFKKSVLVNFQVVNFSEKRSGTTYGLYKYISLFIGGGLKNVFYSGKDGLLGNKSPEYLIDPIINNLRRCTHEIKKTVSNLVICNPNKTDVFWSVPNEADFPDEFFDKIEEIAKNEKLSKSQISKQDELIRKQFLEQQRNIKDAHRILANGSNFDSVISNNATLRKELNIILKEIFNLKLNVVTPKFLKKILGDPNLYRAFRDAQRRGMMYPLGMGMYKRNKFIMLQDLNYKKKFLIHGEEVGKGPTNILPFLAQILSNRPNLTYLVQELENNWHPKYQSKIIELIAKIIKKSLNKNFILETHSELFVLQVQKLVQKGILKPSEVSINYISRNKKGNSEVHNIPLNLQGGFEKKWPGGFFTERTEILTS
jgi:predicted ATPase